MTGPPVPPILVEPSRRRAAHTPTRRDAPVPMPRLARHALIATLIAIHGAVTLCGTGLHALPGLGHDSALNPRAKTDHSHGPGKSAHESADDCQICQFLAQGQIFADLVAGVRGPIAAGVNAPILLAVVPAAPSFQALPRGPPEAVAPSES